MPCDETPDRCNEVTDGQLPSFVLEKTRVGNDWSRGGTDVGRHRSSHEEISKADRQGLGSPAEAKAGANVR